MNKSSLSTTSPSVCEYGCTEKMIQHQYLTQAPGHDMLSRQDSAVIQESKELLPCVIPQVSKSFRGAFFSPMARAYPPALANYGIPQDDFLTFLDGFNEAFVAHPVFQGLGIAGAVMTMAHGVHPVQWAGMGLQVTSGVASAATSYLRTKQYVRAINEQLFNPAGLHVNVMTTSKMMQKIGMVTDPKQAKLLLQQQQHASSGFVANPLGEVQPLPRLEHTRAQTLEALRGRVTPLTFDVPEPTPPDNLLRKMGTNQAKRLTARQAKKAQKKRDKANEEIAKKNKAADKEQRKGDKDVAKKQREADKEIAKIQRRKEKKIISGKEAAVERLEEKESRLLDKVQKERIKRDDKVAEKRQDARKEVDKVNKSEVKVANKIRWLVISKWEGQESDMLEDSKEL